MNILRFHGTQQAAEPWQQFAEWTKHGEIFTVNLQRKAGGRTEPLSIQFKCAILALMEFNEHGRWYNRQLCCCMLRFLWLLVSCSALSCLSWYQQ